MISTTNKIGFSSNVVIVGNSEFARIRDSRRLKEIKVGKTGHSGEEGLASYQAANCTIGVLGYPEIKKAVLTHNAPRNPDKPIKAIPKAIKEANLKQKPTKKFMVGGKFYELGQAYAPESKIASQEVNFAFNRISGNDDITKLKNHKKLKAATNVLYDPASGPDTLYVNPYLEGAERDSTVNNIDELKDFYAEIELAKGDHLFVGGREYSDNMDVSPMFERPANLNNGVRFSYYIPDSSTPVGDEDRLRYIIEPPKSVNIFRADNGHTLWVDSTEYHVVEQVARKIDLIKKTEMFKDIKKINYAGKYKASGFEETGEISQQGLSRGFPIYFADIKDLNKPLF